MQGALISLLAPLKGSFLWLLALFLPACVLGVFIIGYRCFSKQYYDLKLGLQKALSNGFNLIVYVIPSLVLFYYFDQEKISLSIMGSLYIIFSLVAIGFWDQSFVFFDQFWNQIFYKSTQNPLIKIQTSFSFFQDSFEKGLNALEKALQVKKSQLILAQDSMSYKYRTLFTFFETSQAANLVKEKLKKKCVSAEFLSAKETMLKQKSSVAFPIWNKQKLWGILLLGKRLNEQPFSVQELKEIKKLLSNNVLYRSKKKQEKKKEEQLTNSKKVEKDFMTGLIHEICHPLVVASNMKEMIDWEKLKTEDQEYLLSTQNDLHQLSKNLDRVSEVIQWQHNATTLEKTFGNLENVLQVIKKETTEGNISIQLEKKLEKKLFSFDFYNLKRAFQEITKNAFFFNNSDKKTLKIKGEEKNGKIIFTFTDNGFGIEKKHWNNVFDLLFVSSFSRNRSECGFGIGLALVKEIILRHNGTIQVQKSNKKGTTIEIVLNLETQKQ